MLEGGPMNHHMKRVVRGTYASGAPPFAAVSIALLLAFCAAYSDWTRIGLDGMKVTSITAGKVWTDTMLFAGTDSGVYSKPKNGASKQWTSLGSGECMPAGLKHVRSLYLASQTQLFAGSDSGLFSQRFTSGLPPAWTKINGIFGSVVAIAGMGDTLAAVSQLKIYRSVDGGTVWTACTLAFNQNKHPVYTSLAFFQGINAGSDEWFGSAMPWVGVAHSQDFGHTWADISNLPGQAQPLKAVYCLATYRAAWNTPLRLVASTVSGIQWVDDIDTGTWHPLESQLTIAPARHLYVTTYTKSTIAMLFASTDSGVFINDPTSGPRQRCLQKRAYGVTSFVNSDPSEWFAAVEDGVYRYDESTATRTDPEMSLSLHGFEGKTRIVVNNVVDMKNPTDVPVMLYAPNGKHLGSIPAHGVLKHAPIGIVIIRAGRK
jgi:hypothetical protein